MRKFSCNNCGNTFSGKATDQILCPACGSDSFIELTDSGKKNAWRDRTLIISITAVLIMLVILFLLPRSSNRYDVYIEKYADSCMFVIRVQDGKHVMNPENFKFSNDNGKTWQKENVFRIDFSGIFLIKVMHRQDSSKIFTFKDVNPVSFTPKCKELQVAPCDCKSMQVLSVEVKEMNKKQAMIIHASQPECPKMYSINGPDGTYSPDSIFFPGAGYDYSIFIKSENCEPIAYAMNPFHIAPPTMNRISNLQLTQVFNKFIQSQDRNQRNKLMMSILDMCESSCKVMINDEGKQYEIYDYLQRLKTLSSTDKITVVVLKTKFNNFNKINHLTTSESKNE